MSTSGVSLNSTAGAPLSVTGLASGLDTTEIIAALMSAEREPVTHMTEQENKLEGTNTALQSVQTSLQSLSFEVAEFAVPSLFEDSQTATSNEPARVSAAASTGAAVGGYEVEVTQLATSAQRTFAFTSPTAEETLTIDGKEFKLKAGESAKELASAINADSSATVFAAATEAGTIVLSNRETGTTGPEFIKVVDAGGTLVEREGAAKEGQNAEYKVDGEAGVSASNTVANAIPGVTLTLGGLTPAGPVTIDVQPPGPSAAAIEAQVNSFIKLYNSTVEAIQKQLTTKPLAKASSASEFATGALFGDLELTSLLDNMRAAMYEPITGLEAGMSSPFDLGIATGGSSGSGTASQASIEGLLTLNASKLSEAVKTNPAGVEQMLTQWSKSLQSTINVVSEAGGGLETRVNGDTAQITQLSSQISSMNEILADREKALEETYAQLEAVISQNSEQSSYIAKQAESLSSI
ncbi:MAG TPA: flagellar filament capping protein FliD [Solirubrobacteraceae bacterium]|nr:flagellar filament capping protein FliD [Solirubrobacteraceae bacterium]